jgi:hypothetical protein
LIKEILKVFEEPTPVSEEEAISTDEEMMQEEELKEPSPDET